MTNKISNTYRTLVDTPIDQAAEEERNRRMAKLFDGLLPLAEVEILKLRAENADLRARCEEQAKVIEMAREALGKLSTLGNGDIPGNSVGNVIAQLALAAMKEKP